MRKVINVEDLIQTAKYEFERYNRYCNSGDEELAKNVLHRVYGMISLIAITAIKDTDNWDKEWDSIYDKICNQH